MELRLSRGIRFWAISGRGVATAGRAIPSLAAAGLIACASGSAPPAAPADGAVTSTADAPSAVPQSAGSTAEESWPGDPDVPGDSAYADLRAQLEQQRRAGAAGGPGGPGEDPLAPLRDGLARRAQEQIEAQRWDSTRPPAPQASASDATPSDPALTQIAEEIAADQEVRQRADEERRLRAQRTREVEAQVQEARFEMLEQAPLRGCVPSARHIDEIPGDIVRHRRLQRDDFRAPKMSDVSSATVGKDIEPGAHVSITLACLTTIGVVEPGPDAFEARLDGLRFVALLNREKSWWNEEGDHISEEWTLRHEQVHFDLAEVEARRLTAEAGELTEQLIGRGKTPEAAVVGLQQLWDARFEQLKTAFLEMELRYDRETRHGRNLPEQTEWFARAKRGLAESQPATGG